MTKDKEAPDHFRKAVASMNQERHAVREQCIAELKKHQIPTPSELRDRLHGCIGDERQQVMRHHAYGQKWALCSGYESLTRAAHQVAIDVSRHDAALGGLAEDGDFEDHIDYLVGHATQKDVIAYCALAFGIRDTLKELAGLRSDIKGDIFVLLDQVFNTDMSEFFRKLRNNLLHGRVQIPQWRVASDTDNPNWTGTMFYSKVMLMGFGQWNDAARNYVKSLEGTDVHIAFIIRKHYKLLNKLKRQMDDLFARNVTLEEKDFWEIRDSYVRLVRRQVRGILLDSAATGRDPYDYLHRHFSPEETREILRRPKHSKEQVDFMLGLKAAEMDLDGDIKGRLYKVFGVGREDAEEVASLHPS